MVHARICGIISAPVRSGSRKPQQGIRISAFWAKTRARSRNVIRVSEPFSPVQQTDDNWTESTIWHFCTLQCSRTKYSRWCAPVPSLVPWGESGSSERETTPSAAAVNSVCDALTMTNDGGGEFCRKSGRDSSTSSCQAWVHTIGCSRIGR